METIVQLSTLRCAMLCGAHCHISLLCCHLALLPSIAGSGRLVRDRLSPTTVAAESIVVLVQLHGLDDVVAVEYRLQCNRWRQS